MKTSKNNRVLIATGGTGGHVFPAYSLAKNLIKNNYEVEIVTDQRGFKFLEKYKKLEVCDKAVFAALDYHKQSTVVPDYWISEKGDRWIVYPWEREDSDEIQDYYKGVSVV